MAKNKDRKNNEDLKDINYETSKKYKDLEPHDYFVGKIKIIEFEKKYPMTEEIHKRFSFPNQPFENVDINVFKAEGYIPGIHTRRNLKIGQTYDIRGFMLEDKSLHIHYIEEIKECSKTVSLNSMTNLI